MSNPSPYATFLGGIALTRIFAVLIGINSYQQSESLPFSDFKPLRGAVPDVLEFQSYLEGQLGVPSGRIITLTDERATRVAIIDALKGLITDKRIEPGDPILVYYAGHGAELDPPLKWACGGPNAKIQAIVPYDCDVELKSGQRVPPIPDHALEVLFSSIADEKGDNITVIFDCCHSASATRARTAESDGIRRMVLPLDRHYDEQVDSDIWALESTPRGMYTPSRFQKRGLRSHILLAACSSTQLAREANGHGRFSVALLSILKEIPLHKLRYSEILKHLKLKDLPKDQTPQCEGSHLHRNLFNLQADAQRTSRALVVSSRKGRTVQDRQYTVDGGKMHNVAADSEFDVYRASDIQLTKKIGVIEVYMLGHISFVAKLSPNSADFDLDHPTIAIQRHSGKREDLRIFIPRDDPFRRLYPNVEKSRFLEHDVASISIIDNPQNEHVTIRSMGKNLANLTMRTASAGNVGSHLFSHSIEVMKPDVVADIISRIAHFYRELERVDIHNDPQLSGQIRVEFYELEAMVESTEDISHDQLQPVNDTANLYINGLVDIPVVDEDGEGIPYGIKLINNSDRELHMNVLYFNNNDLSIEVCVRPHACASDRTPEVPLAATGGSVAIGYGAAGWLPMTFYLPDNLKVDVGFLKIFLSTEPVQMDHLKQDSPFSLSRAYGGPYDPPPKQRPVFWTSIVIPIIQRQHPFT